MHQNRFSKGFSLLELMITISIIGIFATAAVPSYQSYIQKTRVTNLMSIAQINQNLLSEYINTTGDLTCANYPAPGNNQTIVMNATFATTYGQFNGACLTATEQINFFGPGTVLFVGYQAVVHLDRTISWQCVYDVTGAPTSMAQNIVPPDCVVIPL